jgi:hypothetical protein
MFLPLTSKSQEVSDKPISGVASLKELHGYIPFSGNNSSSSEITFKTKIDCELNHIPFVIDIAHTNNLLLAPSTNHISIKFDTDRYKKIKEELISTEKSKMHKKADSLFNIKSKLQSKLYMCEQKSDSLNKIKTSIIENNLNPQTLTNKLSTSSLIIDSVHPPEIPDTNINSHDTLGIAKTKLKSLDVLDNYLDSLKSQKSSLSGELKNINSQVEQISKIIKKYEKPNLLNDSIGSAKQIDSLEHMSLLDKINKFEIGQASPDYSYWLIKNSLNGFNIESAGDEYFTNISYGTVIDYNYMNQYSGNNPIKQFGNDFEEMFNLSSTNHGRKIIAGQVGYGKQEKSFLAVGLLSGRGKQSYLNPESMPSTGGITEKNLIGEVSGQYSYGNNSIFGAIASSSLKNSQQDITGSQPTLFQFKNKAIELRSSNQLFKTLIIKSESKYVDPFFKSFGVGYTKTNVASTKLSTEKLFHKLKVNLFGKFEKNNVTKKSGYKIFIYSAGAATSYNINRHLNFKLQYNPIRIVSIFPELPKSEFNSVNYSAFITYKTYFQKITWISNISGTNNISYNDSSIIKFSDYSIVNTLIKNQTSLSLNISYLINKSAIKNENQIFSEATLGTSVFKSRLGISATLKGAINKTNLKYGYSTNLTYKILKSFFISGSIEKYCNSSFYNEMVYSNYNNNLTFGLEIKYLF